MSLTVVTVENQAKGQFNGGAIMENKPLGFPQDGGKLKPYSNLFYWAHAWTPGEGSLIGEHPHKGFEIMSFVLKGSLEHYDTKSRAWSKLEAGDAQIIRSGAGISHAEKVDRESEFFQIWLDPDLDKTLSAEPSYDDYKAEMFPIEQVNGRSRKLYAGDGAPMTMIAPGIEISEVSFNSGKHSMPLNLESVYSAYVLEGSLEVNGKQLKEKDYIIAEGESSLEVNTASSARIFIIQSPGKLEYKTYAERFGIRR